MARGYAAVSVADIAAAAGVSVPTVFAGFRSKANLLKEATETALVGDADPVPLHDRPAMRHVVEGATAREVLQRFAALIAEAGAAGGAALRRAARRGGRRPRDRPARRRVDEQRLRGDAAGRGRADRLGDTDPDRLREVRDTIWTLNSPLLFGLLVTQRGWPPERYGAWVARALTALVL